MEAMETGNKNCCATEATHVCEESIGKIKFRAVSEQFCPHILVLESVDY